MGSNNVLFQIDQAFLEGLFELLTSGLRQEGEEEFEAVSGVWGDMTRVSF